MGTYFKEASPEDYGLLWDIIKQHRDDLTEAKAKFTLLLAFSDDSEKPALKRRGKAVAGRVVVNSTQDRAEGKADATITVDGESWGLRSETRRRALLHHELCHVGCHRGQRHPDGRPKLFGVDADWETDGFDEVVAIYGDDAQERRNLNAIEQRLRQESLPMG